MPAQWIHDLSQLLETYERAGTAYAELMRAEIHQLEAAPQAEYEALEREIERARLAWVEAGAALERHMALHRGHPFQA